MLLVDLWLYGMMIGFAAALIFQINWVYRAYNTPSEFNNNLTAVLFAVSFTCAGVSLFAYLKLLLGDPQ